MNLLKNSLLLAVLLLGTTAGKAQTGAYACKRPLGKIAVTEGSGTWRTLVLPNAIWGRLATGREEIRVLGLTAGNDTVEAPYVWAETVQAPAVKEISFRLLNETHNAKGYYYTFEMPAGEPVNHIDLQIGNANFDWRVQLQGSADQNEWFTILEDYRIVALQNAQTDFRFTKLVFPDARYRYLRLLVKGSEAPQSLSASVSYVQAVGNALQTYPIVTQKSLEDKSSKETRIEMSLAQPVPVNSLKIRVTDRFDYYRPVIVEALTDSFKAGGSWRYNYRALAIGTLNSIDSSAFAGGELITQKLRITISNGDNRPLHLGGIEVAGPIHALITRFDVPADYFLVYGRANAGTPDYDIARFGDKIPKSPPAITAGEEDGSFGAAPVAGPAVAPLFQNKVWLWVVIVVIGLLLGGATLKMLRR